MSHVIDPGSNTAIRPLETGQGRAGHRQGVMAVTRREERGPGIGDTGGYRDTCQSGDQIDICHHQSVLM